MPGIPGTTWARAHLSSTITHREGSKLGSIERRAPKSALFFACRFFFLVRPLFSFLAWRAIFLRALFSPSFFFIFPTILASKPCFWAVFPVFLFAPSFALFFFSFESALFFLFSYGGLFFLRPLFALLFFFSPSFLLNLMPYCLWYDVFVPQLPLINELPYILFDININRSHK